MSRLLLITASSPEIRKTRRPRFLNFQQVTMPYLAARVPPGWEVSHVDEEAEAIDWRVTPDVVGITFHTPSAGHAYGIAARFRSRGSAVVMGGPHVTLLPDEARRHADAIFIGEAEGLWDDNLAGDMAYAKALFRAIAPYGKWWSAQASLQAGRDDEFLAAAAESGCKQLFLGLESISQQSLAEVNKTVNRVEDYARAIERIHSHGIAVQAGIAFGFDHDTPEIFEATLEFLEQAGVQNATFNILTPFPGTPLFRRLEEEGRILTRDWRRYNSRDDVVFQPRRMSAAELLAGLRYANARFYSLPSIARRLAQSPVQGWWVLPLNLAYAYRWRMAVSAVARPALVAQPGSELETA